MSDLNEKKIRAAQIFTPSAPVTEIDMLAGRTEELTQLAVACGSPGRHALLFGERGVGKTSLANVFALVAWVSKSGICGKVTCTTSDTYETVLRKLLDDTYVDLSAARSVGFESREKVERVSLWSFLSPDCSPHALQAFFRKLGQPAVLVVDEFDRLSFVEKQRFADTVKVLSDSIAPVTMILVGVARSIEELIGAHSSVERAVAQVRLDRLDIAESMRVIEMRLPRLQLAIEPSVCEAIAHLSLGLPHFIHLVGLGSTLAAIDRMSLVIERADLLSAIKYAIRQADQTTLQRYNQATYSPRVDALFTKVLCACAMSETDTEAISTPD